MQLVMRTTWRSLCPFRRASPFIEMTLWCRQHVPADELKHVEQGGARSFPILAETAQPLAIGTSAFRIALGDAPAILACHGSGNLDEHPATLGRPGVEHVLGTSTLDDRQQRVRE